MTQTQEPNMAAEARAWKSAYELWKESEGLPTLRGLAVDNTYTTPLTPWKSHSPSPGS